MTRPDPALDTPSMTESESVAALGWHSRIARHLEISNILRLCGGGFTAAAILLFLFQRWEDASDLSRYAMIFGETLTLTVLGFVTSRWLKDQKSARVFLGLGLVSTSAVFTILAAMIHSQVQWTPAVADLPGFAVWAIDSMDTVLLLLAGSFAVLGGVSLLTLTVLARPVARRLGLLLMLNTGLLLLPIRDMGITTLLLLPALLFGFRHLANLRKTTPAMRTGEGAMAGFLVMLPLFIMIGRGTYLYAQGPVAIGSLAILTYLLLRQIALSITHAVQFRKLLEVVSLIPAALFSWQLVTLLDSVAPGMRQWLVVFAGITMSGFLTDLAIRAVAGRERYLQAVLYSGLFVSVVEEAFYPGVSTAILGFALSGLVFLHSYGARNTNLLRLSLLVVAGSLILLISKAMVSLNAGTWMSLAVLGMATILLAAAVERYGKSLIRMFHPETQ